MRRRAKKEKEVEVDERLLEGGKKRGRGKRTNPTEEGKEKNNGNIRTSEGPRVVVPRGK